MNNITFTAVVYNKAESKYSKYHNISQLQLAALCCDDNMVLLLVATNGLTADTAADISSLS